MDDTYEVKEPVSIKLGDGQVIRGTVCGKVMREGVQLYQVYPETDANTIYTVTVGAMRKVL